MKEGSVDITKLDPSKVAKELTNQHLLDYAKIELSELDTWKKESTRHLSPNINKMTSDAEQMSLKIRDEILLAEGPKQRGERIAFYIKLMIECKKLNNFHAYVAIAMGLDAVFGRIDNLFDSKYKNKVEESGMVFQTGYIKLRERIKKAEANGVAIPFLGIITGDLLRMEEFINVARIRGDNTTKVENTLNEYKKDFAITRKEKIQAKINKKNFGNPILNMGDWPKGVLLDQSEVDYRLAKIKVEKFKESMTDDTITTYMRNQKMLENTRSKLNTAKTQGNESNENLILSLTKDIESYEKIINNSEEEHPNIKKAAREYNIVQNYDPPPPKYTPAPPENYDLPPLNKSNRQIKPILPSAPVATDVPSLRKRTMLSYFSQKSGEHQKEPLINKGYTQAQLPQVEPPKKTSEKRLRSKTSKHHPHIK